MSRDDVQAQIQEIVEDLDRLGHICRASILSPAAAGRVGDVLRDRAEEVREAASLERLRRSTPWLTRMGGNARRIRATPILATVAAALALLLVLSPLLTNRSGVSVAAAQALRAASLRAAVQPVHPLRAGEYAYTKSVGAYFDEVSGQKGTWGALVRTTREIWVGPDGSGRIRQISETPTFLSPADRSLWEAAGAPALSQLSANETYDRKFSAGGLSPPLEIDGLHQKDLLSLADNPSGLGETIRAIASRNANPLGWEMLTIVGDALNASAAPAKLRAALYQVAATIPGIQLIGTVRDDAGRTGTAVAANRGPERLELIFDPATSALLAQEQTLRQSVKDTHALRGTAIAYTLYLGSGIVSSTNGPQSIHVRGQG